MSFLNGSNGTNGTNGTNGANGTNGTNGTRKSFDVPDPELHKILPNTLYLTFNAPQVDEYVNLLSKPFYDY
jgi:hypothetical protein